MENANFLEIFNDLLSEIGLNRKQFAERCGIPYTTVIGWTTLGRLPDFTALVKIADFFGCPIDYLAGRQHSLTEGYATSKSAERERTMLRHFRKLNNESKDLIIQLTQKLSSGTDE